MYIELIKIIDERENRTKFFYKLMNTARPQDIRPLGVQTWRICYFELRPKDFEVL